MAPTRLQHDADPPPRPIFFISVHLRDVRTVLVRKIEQHQFQRIADELSQGPIARAFASDFPGPP